MAHPRVQFLLPDGSLATVAPGGIIGRGAGSSLRLLDPHISEAHALVSLRGPDLRLIALRGTLEVDGVGEEEIILAPGQQLRLCETVGLQVQEVVNPEQVLALDLGGTLHELCAAAYSVVLEPTPDLIPRLVPDAPATLWSTGDAWLIRLGSGRPETIEAGKSWLINKTPALATQISRKAAVANATVGTGGRLTLVCRTTTVHIQRSGRLPLTVDARAGQLLSELALMRSPVSWQIVAGQLWPDEMDPYRLRRNLDAVLARLRVRLREHGVRDDLVRNDGRGNFEVFLHPGERVVDEA